MCPPEDMPNKAIDTNTFVAVQRTGFTTQFRRVTAYQSVFCLAVVTGWNEQAVRHYHTGFVFVRAREKSVNTVLRNPHGRKREQQSDENISVAILI